MRRFKRTALSIFMSVPVCIAANSGYAAVCSYTVEESSKNGFEARVDIYNDSEFVINGWEVEWAYEGSTQLDTSSKKGRSNKKSWGGKSSDISGNNPYTASSDEDEPLIEPGETVSIEFEGYVKRGEDIEIPTVTGNVCSDEVELEVQDITDEIFTERSADCAYYVSGNLANVMDIQNVIDHELALEVTADAETCTFVSNAIPNHDFNDETGDFGGVVTENNLQYTVTRSPEFAEESTPITQGLKNGIMLNGVRLDIVTGGCYDPMSPDADELGNTGIGCDDDVPWLLVAGGIYDFGVDMHNGHTNPQNQYHYHGSPMAMYDDKPGPKGSPVIGFAADGYPIYGSYFYDSETRRVRKAVSGYEVKEGAREAIMGLNPGGDYDGTYVADWEYTGAGDLDECNGMTVDGQYGYYAIEEYPFVIACFMGTPDQSFSEGGDGGGGGGEGPGGPGGPGGEPPEEGEEPPEEGGEPPEEGGEPPEEGEEPPEEGGEPPEEGEEPVEGGQA